MFKNLARIVSAGVFGLGFAVAAFAQDGETIKVLWLTKSAGFQHSVITETDGKPSFLQDVIGKMGEGHEGVEVTFTKDASAINAANLANYNLIIFYTTGDLTTPGTDQHPPMGADGVAELTAWIEKGGAFMGFHCAADTFHNSQDGPPSPYTEMIGGSFKTHGKQFEGIVKVVDPGHPAVANIPKDWKIADEWYMFRNLNTDKMHVLAVLDPGAERDAQPVYDVPNYPIIWCMERGEGRIYYNAMGHREDVWTNETFQKVVSDATMWVLKADGNEAGAAPNYGKVIPKEAAAK